MKLKYILLLIAAALVLAGSFFLPNAVAAVNDSRRLNNYNLIDSESISFYSAPELSLPDQISLVANPNTELLTLKTGQAMDYDSACAKAITELERFFDGSPYMLDYSGQIVEECSAVFIIDSENPSVSMMVWELLLTDKYENAVNLTIDDETGVILKMIFKRGDDNGLAPDDRNNASNTGQSDEKFITTAIRLAEMMAVYYELPVALADYQFSGSLAYYRADMYAGTKVISMFGVVRTTGFTTNEK